jgi:hypothetical protein
VSATAATAALLALALTGPGARAPAGCRGTLSGAVQGGFTCRAEVTRSEEGKLLLVITGDRPIPGVPSYVPGAFELPDPLRPGTYTLDDLGAGRASVAAEGGALYAASKTSSTRGEVKLALTQVRKTQQGPPGFVVRGTYTARLVAAGAGREGTVVIDVRF